MLDISWKCKAFFFCAEHKLGGIGNNSEQTKFLSQIGGYW